MLNHTLSIFELLGITGVGGLFGGLVIALINHLFGKGRDFEARQWLTKREACLDALSAVDAAFSHREWENVKKQPTPQPLEISKIRECHSKLILSCKNSEVPKKFIEIMIPDSSVTPPTDLLNELRNLIRAELNFGAELNLDNKKAWIGSIKGDTGS